MRRLAALSLVLLSALAGCGGGGGDQDGGDTAESLTVWIQENQPERVRAARDDAADFTRRTGIEVEVVPLGDGELPERAAAAGRDDSLPDVMQSSIEDARAFADRGLLDTGAATQVVSELGEQTFSARALGLLTSGGSLAAVPSDGWGQLLIYRKDLFDRAGLPAPDTLERVLAAARRLTRPGMAGITLATKGGDAFTAETFEHVALAAGCQLVDAGGDVTLTSDKCRRAFALYVELARQLLARRRAGRGEHARHVLRGQGRDDPVVALPARRHGRPQRRGRALVPAMRRRSGVPGQAQRADRAARRPRTRRPRSTARSPRGASAAARPRTPRRFVRFMLSDGYLRWLAISPQGKYPVRAGDAEDFDRYARGWAELESGVDRRAPLSRFYSEASIASLGDGVRSFQRWGFQQDQVALVGAMSDLQPVTEALAAAIRGDITPDEAAEKAQSAVEQLQESLR